MAGIIGPMIGLAWSQSTQGQDVKNVKVHGFGTTSCGLWMDVRANRRTPSDIRFVQAQQWIAGYLSAYNAHVSPTGNAAGKTDQEGMYAWLDLYCKGHPTANVMTALEQFVRAPP